jgi:hypothetical protein
VLFRSWQRSILLMAEVQFGRLEGVQVRNGELLLDPPPRVVRTVKLGEARSHAPNLQQLVQHPQLLDFSRQVARLRDGVIERLEIRDGLPTFMEVAEGNLPEEAMHGN